MINYVNIKSENYINFTLLTLESTRINNECLLIKTIISLIHSRTLW